MSHNKGVHEPISAMSDNKGNRGPIIAPKLHHTTFTTKRLDEMVAWYETVAGLTAVFRGERGAWLTNDEANHRIAMLAPPDMKHPVDKGHTTGLHHTAFEYANFDQWLDNYIRLKAAGILPFLQLDHGMTMSIYYQDPDGNGVEIQVDTFGDWAASKSWMYHSVEFANDQLGEHFDAAEMVKDRAKGLGFAEIHAKARAGDYRPDVIPDIYLPELY